MNGATSKARIIESLPEPQKSRILARVAAMRRPSTVRAQEAHTVKDALLLCGCPKSNLVTDNLRYIGTEGRSVTETIARCSKCGEEPAEREVASSGYVRPG